MSSSLTGTLEVYFSEELTEERPIMRSSLINGGPEGVETLRLQFREFLLIRPMTHNEFWKDTSVWFDSDEELYTEVGNAYRFFFDEEPPAAEKIG